MRKQFYIYYLCDPDATPRYVGYTGRSIQKRLNGHVGMARGGQRGPLYDWIRSLLAIGKKPLYLGVDYFCEKKDIEHIEMEWIADAKEQWGEKILNISRGGGGMGCKRSEETKELLRIANRKAWGSAEICCANCGLKFWSPPHKIKRAKQRFCSFSCKKQTLKGKQPDHFAGIEYWRNAVKARVQKAREQLFCKRGHPLFGENILIHNGSRHCKACKIIRQREYRKAKRANPNPS